MSAKTDAELYITFLEILHNDGHITTDDALSTFNLALALRSAAPRIEAQYQYYATTIEPKLGADDGQTCQSWVQVEDLRYCDPSLEVQSGNIFPS